MVNSVKWIEFRNKIYQIVLQMLQLISEHCLLFSFGLKYFYEHLKFYLQLEYS